VSEKDQIISLLLSRVDVNIQLAISLHQALGIDISDFWMDLCKIYDSSNPKKDYDLPDTLQSLDLTRLDIRLRHPGELPWVLSELKLLKQLTISFFEAYEQQLESDINPCLPLGSSMKNLTIYNCRIKDFPEQIRYYKNLKQLNMGHMNLITLPDWFSELKELEHLYLIDCKIQKLPDKFLFQSVKTIHLSNNCLCEIPESIYDNDFLYELYLDNNCLDEISYLISNLDMLLDLNLGNNNLKEFPEGILELKDLTLLNLCNNPISKIPREISALTGLRMLNLNDTLVSESVKVSIREMLPACNVL